MLRPDQMSKVSVTGSKAVMPSVIEALHDLTLVHLSDYDGSWSGFENGRPLEGSEKASEQLITVRSIKDALDIEREGTDGIGDLSEAELDDRLEEVRSRVNELDDQRSELQDQIRSIDDQIETLEPFATLGIDLDLLWGYDTLDIAVGEGDRRAIEEALAEAEAVEAFETFHAEEILAIAAHGTGDDPIGDALVGIEFTPVEIPHEDGPAEGRIAELATERDQLEAEIEAVEADLADVREDVEEFVLRAERHLMVQVERTEVPLQFATTKRTFIAEGWIPTDQLDRLEAAMREAVGDRVDVEEVERAAYNAAEDHTEAVTDGGQPVTVDDTPPTKLNNSAAATPFEALVEAYQRPKYSELDPTLLIFLTFPFMFGFMIGDIAYGLMYMGIGYFLQRHSSAVMNALGTIALWCGGITVIFGYLYNDFLGMKLVKHSELAIPGLGVLHKGYKPLESVNNVEWVLTWIVLAVAFGVLHMTVGWYMNYVNKRAHERREALFESGGWIMAVVGLYLWVFSGHLAGPKPGFITGADALWFIPQIPAVVGIAGLVAVVIGAILVTVAEGLTGAIEIPSIMLGQTLSYLRIPSVLLAKGGMAMVVLMLTELLLGLDTLTLVENSLYGLLVKGKFAAALPDVGILTGILLGLLSLIVFVAGHILVLILGITEAGIQMLRLEYVEFFQRFYDGGGRKYEPFGQTTSDLAND